MPLIATDHSYPNGHIPDQDSFAKALMAEGLDADTIKAWTVDPQV